MVVTGGFPIWIFGFNGWTSFERVFSKDVCQKLFFAGTIGTDERG